jgi:epoxyqueuosine reductase QueG
MIKEAVKKYAQDLNIEYVGFTNVDGKGCICCLFPYYTGEEDGNISLYCRSLDYHKILLSYLDKLSLFLKKEYNISSSCFADINPLMEVDIAHKCNLGVIGKNKLLINEKYGSFVFIGILLCDCSFEEEEFTKKTCLNCNKCVDICPAALKEGNFNLCLSSISQKKGELSSFEEKLLKTNNIVFGCDICQKVCPMNTYKKTPIKDFYNNRLSTLNSKMFENLSNKEFKQLYGKYAFSWKGKNILLRNLKIFEE